jgi:methenyltetrahydromethanopterin cyclohydrolase
MTLNERARRLFDAAVHEADALRVGVHRSGVTTIVDFGSEAPGGLEAGRRLAEICLAGLGRVAIAPTIAAVGPWPTVTVETDRPLEACLYSQYAGWQFARGKYFAMGSGPMRAASGREPLFMQFGFREKAATVVGVLETRKRPPAEITAEIAERCGVTPGDVHLCFAPTASLAGTLQVVARSVETALHKLHEVGFDVRRIASAFGTAPLPPVAKDDMAAIGRTNDAILYGGDVTLWVRGDDASLEQVGPQVPATASKDYGRPFAEIFECYDRDFYKIDPHLFSPAVVTFQNLDTGRTFRYGRTNADVLRQSFQS